MLFVLFPPALELCWVSAVCPVANQLCGALAGCRISRPLASSQCVHSNPLSVRAGTQGRRPLKKRAKYPATKGAFSRQFDVGYKMGGKVSRPYCTWSYSFANPTELITLSVPPVMCKASAVLFRISDTLRTLSSGGLRLHVERPRFFSFLLIRSTRGGLSSKNDCRLHFYRVSGCVYFRHQKKEKK